MPDKTEGVRILVQDILAAKFSEPYAEDIILEVFAEIKKNREWKRRYDEASEELHNSWVVNNWIGKYTKALTGLKSLQPAKAPEDSLITSYTRLGG
jgi:hypothetical protein